MAKYFKCSTDKNPTAYSLGEEITFTVWAREDGNNIDCKAVNWQLMGDDGDVIKGSGEITTDSPLTVKYTLKRAGFVHLICSAINDKGETLKDFEVLDASAGADILSLTYSDTLPDDFKDYWAKIEKLVLEWKSKVIEYKEKTDGVPDGFKAYYIKLSSPEGRPASGCVSIPLGDGKYPAKVVFMGYGLQRACFEYHESEIFACFNAHGFENDKSNEELEKIYADSIGNGYGFNDEENASNMTTYFRNMMIRDLIALKYVKSLPEWNKNKLITSGGSQGAFQAITVAAHDKDVTNVTVAKPWFCDLNAENEGYLKGWRPNHAAGLRYFDTVAQGMLLKCPINIFCALGDYICPPKTVMALYNSIKSEKKISFMLSATHHHIPPESENIEPLF